MTTIFILCSDTGHSSFGSGIKGIDPEDTDHIGFALTEDGRLIAQHYSSSRFHCLFDMGIYSRRKHAIYNRECPEGYVLKPVADPEEDPDYLAALERNRQRNRGTE